MITRDYIGPVPPTVWRVVLYAWDHPFHIASNYARENAVAVAMAASVGWISNISPCGTSYSRKWHITSSGSIAVRHASLFSPEGGEEAAAEPSQPTEKRTQSP